MFKESMYPFHIEICNKTDLYQLNDGRYQLIRDTEIDSIMIGHKYTLVRDDVVEKIIDTGVERVSFEPAIIWNRKINKVYSNYQKMTSHRHIESSNLNSIDIEGKQFLVLDNHHLFATPELKLALESLDLGLKFRERFGNFG